MEKANYYFLIAKKMFEILIQKGKQSTFQVNSYSSALIGTHSIKGNNSTGLAHFDAQLSRDFGEMLALATKVQKIPNINALNLAFAYFLRV